MKMRYLLDTHILLWGVSNVYRLSPQVRQVLASPDNDVFVSVVTAWEISIKLRLGKLSSPLGLEQEIIRCGFSPLLLTFSHAEAVAELPLIHRDPFDRMLIVQAQLDGLILVTADSAFKAYDVDLLFMK
ncbi:MAG: type II toxin-antitoxin system VapC family toxin [Magnetococcus sp. THC-1_WYH]